MPSHTATIEVDGKRVETLADILPHPPGLSLLFVGKTPTLKSVAAGHYFQGQQGRAFWNRLIDYGILRPSTEFEDDSLLDHRFGITDLVKVPHEFGSEPMKAEYASGIDRVLTLVSAHRPRILVFVYKAVLDQILAIRFHSRTKSAYGFNPELDARFGSRVFALPLPGTPCTTERTHEIMLSFREALLAIGVGGLTSGCS